MSTVDQAVTEPKQRAACFQSVDRAVDRSLPWSTRLFLCMSCIPVDRAVDRSAFVHLVHTGRPDGRPAACCMRRFSLLYLPIAVLSSSISSISSLPTRLSSYLCSYHVKYLLFLYALTSSIKRVYLLTTEFYPPHIQKTRMTARGTNVGSRDSLTRRDEDELTVRER